MPDGIIRDPVHNDIQGRWGVVYLVKEKQLAAYDKIGNRDLQLLPTGWVIKGETTRDVSGKPFQYCGIDINLELVVDEIGGPTGAISQMLRNKLLENPFLLSQPLHGTDREWREDGDPIVIYPPNAS
jgi:hypothetical protein